MRKPIPPNATARDLVRRYVHEDGKSLGALSTAWGCKPFSVWSVFQRTDRPLQPHHVEGAITALQLLIARRQLRERVEAIGYALIEAEQASQLQEVA